MQSKPSPPSFGEGFLYARDVKSVNPGFAHLFLLKNCATACVDGVQVGALFHNHILVDLIDCHGVDVSNLGSLCLSLPISVGAEAGTVRLSDVFTQEEL